MGITRRPSTGTLLPEFESNRYVYGLATLAVLFHVGLLAVFSDQILQTVLSDDIYYYLTLSENGLAGSGVVFNDGVPTNGFHPLYFVVATAFYWALVPFGQTAPVFGLLVVLLCLQAATGLFVYAVCARVWTNRIALVTASIWLFHPAILVATLSGMEVTLQVFAVGLLSVYYLAYRSRDRRTLGDHALLGVLLGVAFLARMDSLFVVLGVFASIAFAAVGVRQWRALSLSALAIRDVVAVGLSALATVSPWLAWSYATTGAITPHSGRAQTAIVLATNWGTPCPSSLPARACGTYHASRRLGQEVLAAFAMPVFAIQYPWQYVSVVVGGLVLAGLGLAALWVVYRHHGSVLARVRALDFLVVGIGLWLTFYLLVHLHVRSYYGILVYFVGLVAVGPLVCWLSEHLRTEGGISRRTVRVTVAVVLVLSVVSVTAIGSYDARENPFREGATYVESEIPDEATVGAFNAGRLQYYTDRDVLNLDGVINSDAYDAIERGTLDCYIYEQNVSYVVDWGPEVRSRLEDPALVRSPVEYSQVHHLRNDVVVLRIEPRQPTVC